MCKGGVNNRRVKVVDHRIKERMLKMWESITSAQVCHSCVYPHRHDRLPQLSVLTNHRCVHMLAKDRPVIIDIGQIDVDGGHVAQRW